MPSKPPPAMPAPGTFQARVVNVFTRLNVVAYRLSGGRVGGKMQELQLLVLHTVGRKSGKRRQIPLLYLPDGDDYVIVASRGGSDEPPAWWLNLKAAPEAEVEIRGTRRRVVAHDATPEEKAALWPRLVAGYSHYDDYQQRTARQIPVVVLSPAA